MPPKKKRAWKSQDGRTFRSPLERDFWDAWPIDRIVIVPQYPIGRYHVDFGHPETRIAIELDGRAWHSRARERAIDMQRAIEINARGWLIQHFTGRQIITDVHSCVSQMVRIIQIRMAKKSE